MKSANCRFSARREQGHVLLEGFQVCTSFNVTLTSSTHHDRPKHLSLSSYSEISEGSVTLQAKVRVERKKGKEETKFVPWFSK